MTSSLHPVIIIFAGALLVGVLKGKLKGVVSVITPVIGLINLILIDRSHGGNYVMTLSLMDLQLELARFDKLSMLFAYLFHFAAIIISIYSLHVRDNMQRFTGLLYVGSAIGAVLAGDLITLFVFWELLAVTSVFQIWARRTSNSSASGVRYLILHISSGLLLLMGATIIYKDTGSLHFDHFDLNGLGGLLIFLAFGMFGYFDLQVPEALQNKMSILSGKQARGTYIGAFIMGALSSLIVTACVAPPLVAAFMVIGQTGNVMRGGIAIFSLSLGMGVPLLLLGASAGKILPKTGEWMTSIKKAFGFMMLALSIWMISRIIPGNIALALWGILFLSVGIYLIRFWGLSTPMSINKKTNASIGIFASMYGAAMLIGAFLGNSNPIQPLAGIVDQTSKKIDSQNFDKDTVRKKCEEEIRNSLNK